MRHDKLERELNLILLLIENHDYTLEDLCKKMSLSRRNLYYYLEFFRDYGFIVENHRPYYRISKDSPFFKKLDEIVHFTEDEAVVMRQLLDRADDGGIQIQRLKKKLDRLYDLNILNSVVMREQAAHNVTVLYEAIKLRRCVVLKNYSSPHSDTRKNRIVEPFLFMNNNNEIRCYELASGMNKTYKISRMEDVEMLDLLWEHEAKHRRMYTDIFMFSDEVQMPVKLRLGRLAYSVLTEEYPQAAKYITQEDDTHWILQMEVCSYVGIGRFVIGLLENIEVLGSDEFKDYLTNKLKTITDKIKKQ